MSGEQAAIDGLERALLQYQTYVGDAVATIEGILAEHADFALGHVFRAGVLMTFGEGRFVPEALKSIERAERLASRANARERGLIAAVRLLVDGDWTGACTAFDRVLVEYPRDIFAVQTAHLFDFYRGDALNLRNRIARVLPAWSASVPGYSYLLGMYAFGLEECNQYLEAQAATDRALAMQPKDAWAVHAGTHVAEMTGRIDDGIHWLESRRADWVPDNSFSYHLWWHLALFNLDRGDTQRVLELYDTAIYPTTSDFSLNLVDASSLLWRLRLLGVDVGARFETLADVWQSKLDSERGFYSFNDMHAMFAFAATGRSNCVARLLGDIEGSRFHGPVAREVGLPIARGIAAFELGRYDQTIALLSGVRDMANRFGGSHAQRDVLTLTIIEAALRSGRKSVARHVVAERLTSRPGSALGWRLHARTL